jgi:hypothetical protein
MESLSESTNTTSNPTKGYILSVHIGGAHFTAGLYCVAKKELVYDRYLRVPLSHKAGADLILSIWKNTIEVLTKDLTMPLLACSLAIPAALDPYNNNQLPKTYKTYTALRQVNILKFFSGITNLPIDKIHLHTASAALLNGQLKNGKYFSGKCLMISIGTDFNAAEWLGQEIENLNWEFVQFKSRLANNTFSTQSLTERYRRLTGISVMNTEQLLHLHSNTPNAKLILRQYLNELMEFINIQTNIGIYEQVFIEGDIALAKQQIINSWSSQMDIATLNFIKPDKLTLLAGGAALALSHNNFNLQPLY